MSSVTAVPKTDGEGIQREVRRVSGFKDPNPLGAFDLEQDVIERILHECCYCTSVVIARVLGANRFSWSDSAAAITCDAPGASTVLCVMHLVQVGGRSTQPKHIDSL